MPFLRDGLRHHGRDQGRPDRRGEGRSRGAGEHGPELHQGLLQCQDHLRRRPAYRAAHAREREGRVRQEGKVQARHLEEGLRRDGKAVQETLCRAWAERCRGLRLRTVHHHGRVRRGKAHEGRVPLEQPRSERAPLHGQRRGRLHGDLRHRRAGRELRRYAPFRHDRALGREHGGDAPGPVVQDHQPKTGGHQARQGREPHDLHQPLLQPRRHRDRHQAEHGPGDPELHPPGDREPARRHRLGLREPELRVRHRLCGHRLRAASEDRPPEVQEGRA